MSLTETAIITVTKNTIVITTHPSGLGRPVELLSDNINKASKAFYDVHSLMIRKKSLKALQNFVNSKNMIKAEFESIHQLLQSSYRHIIDFTGSCKRAPDERAVSAQRCHRSGKTILRTIQDVTRSFEMMLESFEAQKDTLCSMSKIGRAASFSSKEEAPMPYPLPEDSVSLLYDALEDVCSALKDLFIFWDGHVSFLTLVLNRQTNSPIPGEETDATVNLWTEYQRIILKANSSISHSIETISTQPVIIANTITRPRQLPWRRHTYPQTKLRREPTIIEKIPKPASQWQELATRHSAEKSVSSRLTGFIRGLFL